MIQWTTPMMLAGLGLLAFPILAHLLSLRSRNNYFFSTNRFLEEAASQQNRFLRLKRWLLLIVRCCMIAFIVLAFARPIWEKRLSLNSGTEELAVIILLDTSVSTSQSIDGGVAFQALKATTIRTLNQLRAGIDSANIVLAEDVASPIVPELTKNLRLLHQLMRKVDWNYGRADIEGAFVEISKQFDKYPGKKLLVIVSDMQATNWMSDEIRGRKQIALPKGIETKFIQLPTPTSLNFGVVNPRCFPADPLPGQNFQVVADVGGDTNEPTQLSVTLSVVGGESQSQTVRIEPGSLTPVSFDVEFDAALEGAFVFSIPDDRFSADNKCYFAVRRGVTTPVVMISDDPPEDIGTSAFFMERALRPFNDIQDRYKMVAMSPGKVVEGSLTRFEIAVVGYVSELNDESCAEIARFVREGGNLIYLCGEGDVNRNLKRLAAAVEDSLLPFEVVAVDRFSRYEDAPYISAGKWRSPWLQAFDVSSQVALRDVRLHRVWSVDNVAEDADILLTYSDGRPALAHRYFGRGHVLLANFSPSTDFSEFGTYGAFAALIQMLVGHLGEQLAEEAPIVPKPIRFTTALARPNDASVQIIDPEGVSLLKYDLTDATPEVLVITQNTQPGFYRMETGENIVQTIAVNIDPRESDLRRISTDKIEFIEGREFSVQSLDEYGSGIVDQGQPLWGWLAMIALLALTAESLMLAWWRR
ncbi:MAG TPA: BatA and WFA domain-containing protein [Pirellulaceae bacterium]|nr:BatA and WFA domain-containing protein [Pirellulaceae bacterium]HMO91966.1 BatA and WFA domain-containing protein [Pirellulaceae bacterium]HMP68765.1 BatA and WFA domain-containing protein [Pirellulaceae bacterium]